MARRKQPPIRIDPGVVPVVTANPNTTADATLKLASVGATIIVVKLVMDKVVDDDMIEWLLGHTSKLPGQLSFVDQAMKTVQGYVPTEQNLVSPIVGYVQEPFVLVHDILTNLGLISDQAKQQKTTLENQIAADQAEIPLTVAKMEATQAQIDALITNKGFTDPADWDAQKAALQATYWGYAHRIEFLNQEIADDEKQQKIAAANAVIKEASAERGRWIIAVLAGTLIATTMIYAGDSVIDLAESVLTSLFGFPASLMKVIPA